MKISKSLTKEKTLKEFNVKCENCGKDFTIIEDIKKFPSKKKYFCCRSCANTRHHSKETKEKISQSLNKIYEFLDCKYIKQHELDKIKKYWKDIFKENKLYFHIKPVTGSYELDLKYPELSFQSVKSFNKLIPFGFDILSIYSKKIIEEYYKCKNLLFTEYYINKLSVLDIYNKYDCKRYFNSVENLVHFIKRIIGKLPNFSESVNLAIERGKLNIGCIYNQYKCGWHTTWENKYVFLRSSYELDYAKYLLKIK